LIDYLRQQTDQLLADYRHAKQSLKEEKIAKLKIDDQLEHIEKAQKILQEIAQQVQQQAHLKIVNIVSKCLATVGFEYTFRIDFVQRRGKTEAELVFVKDGHDVDPMDAAGGAPLQIAAFGLRLTAILLSKPRKRKVLIMDEPFKDLHESVRSKIPPMLMTLAKELGFQFLMVTNDSRLKTGKVVEIG
jgi:ABC-type uncharacterized transport system YnjBCD ATPase subunit